LDEKAKSIEENRRQAALESLGILDTPNEERFDRLARIAQQYFKVPIVLITFLDGERQWYKSHIGVTETEGPHAMSICSHTIEEDRILYLSDTSKDPQFRDHPYVTGPPHIRFYAGAPLRTPDGYRIGTLCIVDTEPRKLSEVELQVFRDIAEAVEHEVSQSDKAAIYATHQASRANAILDTISDALFTLDENGELRTCNQAVESVFGYTIGEILQKNINDLLASSYKFRAHPDEIATTSTKWVDADGHPHDVEGIRKNGQSFPMQIVLNEMAHFNQRQFVGIARDVTAQKRQEWFLDAIIENLPSMVFVKDAEELRFTLFNKAGEELLGASRHFLIGKTDFDFVPEEQATAFTKKDREVLRQHGPVDIWEELIDSPTKGRRILHTRKVAIRDELGTPRYLLGISQDITEHKRIENELAASLEETERASRGKSEFLAHMSHELRSPLNSIIGFSQIMRDAQFGKLDERYAEYSGDIYNSATHLLELINEILDISRIEAGELVLDESDVDLALPIYDAVRSISVSASQKSQTLSADIESGLYKVRADSRQIRQILINLLSNAVRFTPEKGHVAVEVVRRDEDGLDLIVTDDGIGIAAEDIPKVLEPFGQARQDSLLAHEGTGLGLTLCKRLTELHGGQLSIDSTLGKGTTVTVSFPPERTL